jgi:uncharacterized protein YbaA (DUF1428 family)
LCTIPAESTARAKETRDRHVLVGLDISLRTTSICVVEGKRMVYGGFAQLLEA